MARAGGTQGHIVDIAGRDDVVHEPLAIGTKDRRPTVIQPLQEAGQRHWRAAAPVSADRAFRDRTTTTGQQSGTADRPAIPDIIRRGDLALTVRFVIESLTGVSGQQPDRLDREILVIKQCLLRRRQQRRDMSPPLGFLTVKQAPGDLD